MYVTAADLGQDAEQAIGRARQVLQRARAPPALHIEPGGASRQPLRLYDAMQIWAHKSSQCHVTKLNGLGRSHQRAQAPPALHREPGAASKQLQTQDVKVNTLGHALLPKNALGKRSWAHPACTGGGKRVQLPRSSQRKLLQDTGRAFDECRESSECSAQ